MINNILPNKSRNPENLKNNKSMLESFSSNVHKWQRFAEGVLSGFLYSFVFQVLSENTLSSKDFTRILKDFYTKII